MKKKNGFTKCLTWFVLVVLLVSTFPKNLASASDHFQTLNEDTKLSLESLDSIQQRNAAALTPPVLQPLAQSIPFAGSSSTIADWILDEEAGYIYAISKWSGKVYFINKDTLVLEKELAVGGTPQDLVQYGTTLYIAVKDGLKIQKVDLTTQTIADSIKTLYAPISISATSTHIFYSTDYSNGIYAYSLQDKTSKKLPTILSGVLVADEAANHLYIGETGYSSNNFIIFDYKANKEISTSIYGFSYPASNLYFDEKYIFFAGSRIKKDDTAKVDKTYPNRLLDVSKEYVLTDEGIFDKESGQKIANYPSHVTHGLIDSNGVLYIYNTVTLNEAEMTIKAYQLNASAAEPIVAELDEVNGELLRSEFSITNWVTEDGIPYLYAVSAATNELIIIRKEDFSVVKKVIVGSLPTHIELANGKVYISLRGETRIAVFDMEHSEGPINTVESIWVEVFPQKLQVDDNQIFYKPSKASYPDNVRVINLVDRVEKQLPYTGFLHALYLDREKDILYLGDHEGFFRVNSNTLQQISRYSYSNYDASLFRDGEFLYYGGGRFRLNPFEKLESYVPLLIYAKGNLVFSKDEIVDRDTQQKIRSLPFVAKKIFMSDDGTLYMSAEKSLYKFPNLAEIDRFIEDYLTPHRAMLLDMSITEGHMQGYLAVEPPVDRHTIQEYSAYFMDADKKGVGGISMFPDSVSEDGTRIFEVYAQNIPKTAAYIAIRPVIDNTYNSFKQGNLHIIEIYDTPTYIPTELTMIDFDSSHQRFSGSFTWKPGKKEPTNANYHVFLLDEAGPFGDSLASVATGQQAYSVSIEAENIPDFAIGFALVLEKDMMMIPIYNYLSFSEAKTSITVPHNHNVYDVNRDGRVNVTDYTLVLYFLSNKQNIQTLKPNAPINPATREIYLTNLTENHNFYDVNLDGNVNVSDLTYILYYISNAQNIQTQIPNYTGLMK